MSLQHQEHKQHQPQPQPQPQPTNPAKAVQYVCRLLRSHGVGAQLTAEMVRQAKFDAAASCQPLLLAAHDLALLVLAGFPPTCCEGLTRLRQQLQQEAVQEAQPALSQSGRLLLLHCLSEWGCPAGLVAQLTLPQPSSRAALLALCWLIAHAQLFERALEQLQVPQHLLPLLPPYPQDTSLTAEAQNHFQAAASAARQHHQHIHQLLQEQANTAAGASRGRSSSATTINSSSHWPAVQTAAHHVLATYRATTLRLQQLACLAEAREKMLHEVQQLQQAAAAAGGSTSSSRTAQALTPFELHLLAHPAVLQQHQQALAEAVGLLQGQQECRQHAAVFFAWATSAVAEPAEQQGQAAAAQAHVYNSRQGAGKQQQGGHAGPQQQAQPPLPAPSLQEMLLLVQQLPPCSTQTATGVLDRVHKQLQQAAAAAGLDVSSTLQDPCQHDAAAGAVGSLVQQLDSCMIGTSAASPPPLAAAVTAAFSQAAAAALVESGVLPAACAQELQELPGDLQHTMQQLQASCADQHQRQQQELAAAQQARQYSSLHRQQQQQPQQQHTPWQRPAPEPVPRSSAVQAAGGVLGSGSGLRTASHASQTQSRAPARLADSTVRAGSSLQGVAVSDELQRLNSLALQVAKLLAKTRASNKQQLLTAAAQLLEAGDGTDRQQLVLYQA